MDKLERKRIIDELDAEFSSFWELVRETPEAMGMTGHECLEFDGKASGISGLIESLKNDLSTNMVQAKPGRSTFNGFAKIVPAFADMVDEIMKSELTEAEENLEAITAILSYVDEMQAEAEALYREVCRVFGINPGGS